MNHNNQRKIALINDISGFGRCSITVELPIISQLQVQCCPILTSIFSNHTGYDSYYFMDFTSQMRKYIDEWEKLGLSFNGICTGFLGSAEQIEIVSDFFKRFKQKDTIVVVDPVMGDYGKPYPTYTRDMCDKMSALLQYADIITPNLTEACILTNTPYKRNFTLKEIKAIAEKLSAMGPEKIVITGLIQKSFIANFCFEKENGCCIRKTHAVGTERAGTGDIFTAIIAADAVNHVPFNRSVKRASNFIRKCIMNSIELDIPLEDGVSFEEVMHTLKPERQ